MSEFKSNAIAAVNYIECPVNIDADAVRDLTQKVQVWARMPSRIHALDFKRVRKLVPAAYPIFRDFKNVLRQKNFRLVTINLASDLEAQLIRDGVLTDFGFIRDLSLFLNAKTTNQLGESELRLIVTKATVESIRRAMETLFGSTVAADENFLQNQGEIDLNSFHCGAVIDSKSAAFSAQFRLLFPKETLYELTYKMIGESDTDEETVTSLATELLNMIYGGAKAQLNDERGLGLPACLPRLVLKDQLRELVRSQDPRRCICIPLVSPVGTFYAEIDFG